MGARHILCQYCEPAKDWHIPDHWSADYAMAWFHTTHLLEHVEEIIAWVYEQETCRACRRVVALNAPVHRPCFDPKCFCDCSYTTTASERTAHAE